MSKSIHRKELIIIYRQEILKDIRLFTSQPVAKFYDSLFLNLDLSFVPKFPKTGRKVFSNHAMICAFIVMKSQVLYLSRQGIIDSSFIGLDSTPIAANTSQNNPKSFSSNKFKPENQPKADVYCKLGAHTASNQTDEKRCEKYLSSGA